MGDRVYASITFGGHIEAVEDIQKLADALSSVRDEAAGVDIHDAGEAATALRSMIEEGRPVRFSSDEVNYGEFTDLEAVVKDIPGLTCVTEYEAGSGFDSGFETITPDGEKHLCCRDRDVGATIAVSDLVRASDSANPLAALRALIDEAKTASGWDLPGFNVSPAVAAWLKIFAEKAA